MPSLQGTFLIQESNPHILWLLHGRWILNLGPTTEAWAAVANPIYYTGKLRPEGQ